MTTNDRFESELAAWLQADARQPVPDRYDAVLAATSRAPQRPWWSSLERWLPVDTTLPRRFVPAPRFAWLLVTLALLVALGAVVLAVGSIPRNAEPFGLARNGDVVFGTPDGEIYTRDPNTGESQPLVSGPEIDLAPAFSKDGSRFVFARHGVGPQHAIMLANADGSGVRPLTDMLTNLSDYAWSPDGTRLAVVSDLEGLNALWLLAVDGTKQVLVHSGQEAEFVQWRPDGGELVFRGVVPTGPGETIGLFTVRADGTGTGPEAILPPTYSVEHWQNPALSPDGTKIIYTQWDGDAYPGGHLYVVDVDTGKLGRLVFEGGLESDYFARWSPDGSQIVFNRGRAKDKYYLAVGPAGGGQAVKIGPELPWDSAAVAEFSPDGSKVIARYSNGESWIFDVATGDGQRQPATNEFLASWQRRAP